MLQRCILPYLLLVHMALEALGNPFLPSTLVNRQDQQLLQDPLGLEFQLVQVAPKMNRKIAISQ
jgi:hypothetical protein